MNREQALLRLTDRQRELIRLRDHEKLTFREVAQRLDFSTGYATKLYHEAVKELRQLEEVDELEWQTPPQSDSEPAKAIDEKTLYKPSDYVGRILIDGKPTESELMMEKLKATGWPHQTEPQADSEPTQTVPEPALEVPQVSPQRKPLVAIATAEAKPKVKWVTGVPMVLPKQGPVSVTIRR